MLADAKLGLQKQAEKEEREYMEKVRKGHILKI